jgi:hypothetical protein
MPTGTATIDFGDAPVTGSQASVPVTGQTGILAASHVEAFLQGAVVADPNGHSEDEHLIENLRVRCGAIVAGTGFTIYGECELGTTQGKFTVHWVWA